MNGQQIMTRAPVIELERLKPLWRIYAEMFLRRGPEWNPDERLPPVTYRQRRVRANADAVAAYRRVCGEGPPDRMPPLYPHVLATPLQLNLLGSDDVPLQLAGLVHLGQAIEWHQPLRTDDTFDIECILGGPEDSDLGWMFRLDTCLRRGGERVWREEISFLKPDPSRRARPKRRDRDDAGHFVPLVHMQFPEDTGRRYARVSGDWNPIHLWPLTARRFGFKRPIAHGMYSLARSLAVLETRGVTLTGKRLEAQFRAPAVLPAFNNFCLSDRRPDELFALMDAGKGRILVEGRLSEM